jgi:hypothetical protein
VWDAETDTEGEEERICCVEEEESNFIIEGELAKRFGELVVLSMDDSLLMWERREGEEKEEGSTDIFIPTL